MAVEKLAAGIRGFSADAETLKKILKGQLCLRFILSCLIY